MPPSRRSLVAAAGAGLAAVGVATGSARARTAADKAAAELIERSADANAALLRGDVDRYRALVAITDDFTLMSPFGGTPSRGADITEERWQAMRRFFHNGALRQELVQAYASADMVALAVIEHCSGEIGGLPAQNWPLRVTLVFRREDGAWRLAHRHADPLVAGVSLERAAALARGDAR